MITQKTAPAPVSRGGGKALKLGSKTADDDLFVKQLKSEGNWKYLTRKFSCSYRI